MRLVARVGMALGALMSVACGSYVTEAPPSTGLTLFASFNPDATGGMRPATTVTAQLFVEPSPGGGVAVTPLEKAEFIVWGGAGRVLAQVSVPGPLPFDPDGSMTVRQVLDWQPPDALGHEATVRLTFRRTAPEASPLVIERTVTF